MLGTETHDVFCPRHFGVRRYGRAQFGKFATHQQFVLSEDQSLRRRLNVHAFGNKNLEMLRGHVLVVERQRVGTDRCAAKSVEVGVAAEHDVGADLSCRLVRSPGEHSERLAQGHRRLVSHPGQLSATDHGDDGHGCFCRSRGGRAGGDLRGIVVAGHGSLCCHVPRSPVHSAFPICDSADESAANWW